MLTLNHSVGPQFKGLQNPSYNYESVIGKGKESTEYRLSLATTGNFVYYVYFDKFYLKKDESIYVDKSDDLFIRPVLQK